MELHSKVHLTVLLLLIIALITPAFFSIREIQHSGMAQIEEIREELGSLSQNLTKDAAEIVHSLLNGAVKEYSTPAYREEKFGRALQDVVLTILHFAHMRVEQVTQGKLSLEEAQKHFLEELRTLRVGAPWKYVWVQDSGEPFPRMVMHPIFGDLTGQVLDHPIFNTAGNKGLNVYLASIQAARNGNGFIDHFFDKPRADGTIAKNIPKLSFAGIIPEWNWIIGYGQFLDDEREILQRNLLEVVRGLSFNGGRGHLWIAERSGRILLHPDPAIIGRVSTPESPLPLFEQAMTALGSSSAGFAQQVNADDGKTAILYARTFMPFQWIIGAVLDTTPVNQAIARKEQRIQAFLHARIRRTGGFFLGMLLFSVLVVSRVLHSAPPQPEETSPVDAPPPNPAPHPPSSPPEPSPGGLPVKEMLEAVTQITRASLEEQTRLQAFRDTISAAGGRQESGAPHLDQRLRELEKQVRILLDEVEQRRPGPKQKKA